MRTDFQPEIFAWPDVPPLPASGQVVLVRVATSPFRAAARQELRSALRTILAAWSGLATGQMPLHETPQGPVWNGRLAGEPLEISFSHGHGESWMGLRRGGRIGIDVTPVKLFAEMDAVARDYLGPAVAEEIQRSADPAQSFALAWAEREARLKCFKRGLVEWEESVASAETGVLVWKKLFGNGMAVAVAVAELT